MKNKFSVIFACIAYIAMVYVNFLANSLPINNRSTGAISDAYPNLFAPAGVTFSIWGLIYLMLAAYLLYQFVSKRAQMHHELLQKINYLFIATSIANIFWIFSWHYDFIGLSVLIMTVLLVCLIKIADTLRVAKLSGRDKLFISTPFYVYFGWITVATIANITVFFVSINWNGFGISDVVWTSIILLIGTLIGILRMRKDRNVAFGLVLIWAYLGILLKHLTTFDGQYQGVIGTVIVCLIAFAFFSGRLFYNKNASV